MTNGYAICLNKWALDKEIKNELGLLLIISSLCAEKGYCYASNKYLAEQFEITEQSISNKIKKLENKNYIKTEYEKRGCEVISRKIRLKNFYTDDIKKIIPTIEENFKENNTSINNTSINRKKEIYKERKFEKPTLEEVKKYCVKRGNDVDAEQFIDFYESKGWYVGKNKMKDWKACVRTWEKRHNATLPYVREAPEWFDKQAEIKQTTEEEQEEFEKLLNEIGG